MIIKPMDVLTHYEIRKTTKQKAAFEHALVEYVQQLGYPIHVEQKKRGPRNIVMGDPDNAKFLVTAHYDTPASIGLPNLITPNNPVAYILIQAFLVGILLATSFGAAALAKVFGGDEKVMLLCWYVVYFGLLILLLRGPANRHNANDNTSGVVTVLEIMNTLPENLRDRVCFVLFDLEERGLVGSAAYRKAHKEATEQQIVLNLDCVGDGDVIQFTLLKKAAKDQQLLQRLERVCGKLGQKEIRLRAKGFRAGSSDHKNFPYGVGIMAFRNAKFVGLYCGRIHTWRDMVLEQSNVNILRAAIISLICQ